MREHAAALLMGESRRGQRSHAGEGERNDQSFVHGNLLMGFAASTARPSTAAGAHVGLRASCVPLPSEGK